MPVKIDETDARILKALIDNGRMSYRQIARMASVSTPTVESRVKRLFDTGLIRRIAAIIDTGKIEHGVYAVVVAKTTIQNLSITAKKLAALDNIRNVYTTSGDNNLLFTVFADSLVSLESFLSEKVASIEGVSVISYDVITAVAKDEPGAAIRPGWGIRVSCDQCGDHVKGDPVFLKVENMERYFCSKTCLAAYKERFGARILKLTKPSSETGA